MPRAAAKANAVADSVVTLLRLINAGPGVNVYGAAADSDKWLTKPAAVERQLMADAVSVRERPHVAVEVASVRDILEGAGQHRKVITIDVHLIADHGGDSETRLVALAADVEFAIAQDETLGGTVMQFPSEDAKGEAFEYAVQTEAMFKIAGLAMATVRFTVDVRWDHTTANPS